MTAAAKHTPTPSGKPSSRAMELAAEYIGPDVLVRLNQRQLAAQIERGMAPVREKALAMLRQVDADSRFHYEPAIYQINGPLALIQVSLNERARVCQVVLEALGYDGPGMDIEPGPRKAEQGGARARRAGG